MAEPSLGSSGDAARPSCLLWLLKRSEEQAYFNGETEDLGLVLLFLVLAKDIVIIILSHPELRQKAE